MDEGTRASGPAVDEQRGPEEIREDIAQTREELGDTVEALAGKADVKGQAKAKADDVKQRAREKVGSVKERVGSARDGAGEHTPDAARDGAQRVKQVAAENPVPAAVIGGFVAGVVVSRILRRR